MTNLGMFHLVVGGYSNFRGSIYLLLSRTEFYWLDIRCSQWNFSFNLIKQGWFVPTITKFIFFIVLLVGCQIIYKPLTNFSLRLSLTSYILSAIYFHFVPGLLICSSCTQSICHGTHINKNEVLECTFVEINLFFYVMEVIFFHLIS